MQDDVFFSKLTVRQTLTFTADVRLPRSMTPQERTARVDLVISKLGLEKCQHTIVGDEFDRGISGGERKRLNIANELIHEPSLFLADECTTGLDSSSALNVLNVLEGLCEEERTVIVTIHQPSSRMFVMFSKILLLAAGRVAYFGKPDKMKRYLQDLEFPFPSSTYNPAEYALELLMGTESVDGNPSTRTRILDAWSTSSKSDVNKKSESKKDDSEGSSDNDDSVKVQVDTDASIPQDTIYDRKPPTNHYARFVRAVSKRLKCISGVDNNEAPKYKVGWWQQTRALMRRTSLQKQGLLLQAPDIVQLMLTVILTVAFWFRVPPKEGRIEDRLGLIAFYSVNWAFFAMNSSIFAFPPEREVLRKDRSNGVYRLSCYYVAKSMVSLRLIQTAISQQKRTPFLVSDILLFK